MSRQTFNGMWAIKKHCGNKPYSFLWPYVLSAYLKSVHFHTKSIYFQWMYGYFKIAYTRITFFYVCCSPFCTSHRTAFCLFFFCISIQSSLIGFPPFHLILPLTLRLRPSNRKKKQNKQNAQLIWNWFTSDLCLCWMGVCVETRNMFNYGINIF